MRAMCPAIFAWTVWIISYSLFAIQCGQARCSHLLEAAQWWPWWWWWWRWWWLVLIIADNHNEHFGGDITAHGQKEVGDADRPSDGRIVILLIAIVAVIVMVVKNNIDHNNNTQNNINAFPHINKVKRMNVLLQTLFFSFFEEILFRYHMVISSVL